MVLNPTTQIVYSAAGTRRGPISYAEFITNVEANLIHSDDLVWHEGLPDWVRADTIVEFPDRSVAQPAAAPAFERPSIGKASLSAPKANYLVRHWRGELSLPVSYWLNNILASVILFTTIFALGAMLDDYDPKSAIVLWSIAILIYVAIVGRPVARKLDDGKTFEITRLASAGMPNACSMLLGACRREALKRGYRQLVTYTLAEENGVSLRAAGYREASRSKGGRWARTFRPPR
ncbi:MAG: DUF4339 domain-containing protein [Rhodocyclaceae bacterium]|nr:DUF4339 domain-containing protein [Rhodocyclaceae bacterium]